MNKKLVDWRKSPNGMAYLWFLIVGFTVLPNYEEINVDEWDSYANQTWPLALLIIFFMIGIGKQYIQSKNKQNTSVSGWDCVALNSFIFSLVLSGLKNYVDTYSFAILTGFILTGIFSAFNE
jgi:hypothetical protein